MRTYGTSSCIVLGLLLAAPAPAQVIRIEDVSPDFSTLSDPAGASGGRVNGTAVDPNNKMILYAASEWGGIYKSTDGGDNWAGLDGHRAMVTWDVEVDPSNSNRIYATSFYDGRSDSLSGINVSTDGGDTWTHPATSGPSISCATSTDVFELTAFGISIDPTNNSNVYVGTSCGLAVSNDSGATWWYTAPAGVGGGARMWDVLVSADGSLVDTCGDDGHQFLDIPSGIWTSGGGLPSGRCSLAASPYTPNNQTMFAAVGTKIYETSSGGGSWTNTRTNPSPQGRIPFVATNERAAQPVGTKFNLWFGDVHLYRVRCDHAKIPSCGTGDTPAWNGPHDRSDGGHPDLGSILFNPSATNNACPILMSSDGGVYRNTRSSSPSCHNPVWAQPSVSPHGLWPFAMAGANRAGIVAEDLYFGNQDNGVFGTTDAGAASPTWETRACCDGFDTAADDFETGTIIYSVCCSGGSGRSTKFYKRGAGFTGGGQINAYPPGGLPPGFKFPDSIFNWADKKYVMITRDCTPGSRGCPGADGGVFITHDIEASPIVWIELGDATEPPSNNVCAVQAATVNAVPTFFAQSGNCNASRSTDRLFKFTGTDPSGAWTEITLPEGGVGVFAVDPRNPQILLASGFTSRDAFMYKSTDGGTSWNPLNDLDNRMTYGGGFPMKNARGPTNFTGMGGYRQPSLVAIDPTDSSIWVAGGRDSGVFLSTSAGINWRLVTDPWSSHTSGIPHIPRPRYAYFDELPGGGKAIYIASQGRGIWRLTLADGCEDDAFELNGTDNTDDTCFGMNLGTVPAGPQSHLHCDEDWIWFATEAGKTYVIETSNLIGGSDTTLSLHRTCGAEIDFDDNGGSGAASRLVWTSPTDTAADIRIRQANDAYGDGKGYDITVTEACATDSLLANQVVTGVESFIADNTITLGPNFTVAAGGTANLTAGSSVIMLNGTSVSGELTVTIVPSPCPGVAVPIFTGGQNDRRRVSEP